MKLSLEEYLDTIVKLMKNDGHRVEELRSTKIIARVAIIMVVMHHKESEHKKDHIWTNDELRHTVGDEALMELQKAAMDFMWTYIDNNVSFEPSEVVSDKEIIIYDQMVLREIISYLLRCRRTFYDTVNEQRLRNIGQFKKLTEQENIDVFYDLVMKLIVEYETDIYHDLTETAKEMTEKIQR